MDNNKLKVCIFIHYSISTDLPYYVKIYIEELSLHFDKIKVLTNNAIIQKQDTSFNGNVEFVFKENLGYDFGMFYRYIKNKNLGDYSQLAIVNDSNLLLNKLDKVFHWGENNKSDFWGIINSNEKPWFSEHVDNYHIQSHFLVLKENAIAKLPDFLNSIDAEKILSEKNPKQLRRIVINNWEIGLSQFFIKNKLKADSFIVDQNFENKDQGKIGNLTHSHYHELVEVGYPLLKKKVTRNKKKWYKREDKLWQKTIQLYGNKGWDLEKLISEN